MAGIYKAYDIRGLYGDTLTEGTARDIGRAFATLLKSRKVVVGRDMRKHSDALFAALADGLTMQGADVLDLGLCTTPMSYYGNGLLEADGSIMITASHNPPEWNGFKLCRESAIPMNAATGIGEIERIVNNRAFAPEAKTRGRIAKHDVGPEYIAHVRKLADIRRPVRVAIDFANSMGICEAKSLEGLIEIDPLYDQLDGSMPNHEANPLKTETLEALQEKIRGGSYDFGAAFDGDADRVGFVDEKGEIIPMDIATALIAQDLLQHEKGTILYDLRSSWAVKEVIQESGGTPRMSRVGHAFIKPQMRELKALYAGELSGHYYFRDNYYTESSAMAVICMANIVSRGGKPLSELIKPIKRYFASGEINITTDDVAGAMKRLRKEYPSARIIELDGLTMEFADWWFNLRASNTEPLVRLNVEARTKRTMEQRRDDILAIIRNTR